MINLLIVDDEYFVRVGISTAFDWGKYNIQVVGEAANGQEALNIIHQNPVDVILLDIVMPVMSGIDFLKVFREEDQDAAVIVLSANSDFEHVREAMRLGAVDYLLKLSIDTQNLLNLILTHGRKHAESSPGDKKTETISEMWSLLLLDNHCRDRLALQRSLGLEDSDILHILILGIDNYYIEHAPEKRGMNDRFLRTVKQMILKEIQCYGSSIVLHIQHGQFVALLKQNENSITTEQLESLLKMINRPLQAYEGLTVSMGTSITAGSLKDIHSAYKIALNTYNRKFFLHSEALIIGSDMQLDTELKMFFGPDDESKLRHSIVETRNFEYARQNIHRVLDNIEQNRRYSDRSHTLHVINEILFVLFSCMKTYNLSDHDINSIGEVSPFEQLQEFDFFSDLEVWFLKTCEECFFLLKQVTTPLKNQEVQKMLLFIQNNYNKKIDLNTISAHAAISAAYASHIFKKEVGRGIVEYLSHLRIEKAKELLRTTNMGLADIASIVGFDNIYYFSSVFKRLIGVPPGRYRDRAFRKDNEKQTDSQS